LQGRGTYVDDLRMHGLLHASILRSPHAHARIVRIDASAARALPGVVAVLTGADVNAACGLVPCAASIADLQAPKHTVLAGDRVYFVGHAVAAVVASDPYAARDAVDAIDVDYDPLPVVVNPEGPEDARGDDSPVGEVLHAGVGQTPFALGGRWTIRSHGH